MDWAVIMFEAKSGSWILIEMFEDKAEAEQAMQDTMRKYPDSRNIYMALETVLEW